MTHAFAALSSAIADTVAAFSTLLAAIRVGPNRHVTGLICPPDLIVTIDQGLPALDTFTVVLPGPVLAPARAGRRDPVRNLAMLRLEAPVTGGVAVIAAAMPGTPVLVLGADSDASPTVRLTVVHRLLRTPDGPTPILDMEAERIDQGSLVCDGEGRLLGLASVSAGGEAMVVPAGFITAVPEPVRRGWLGVSLQPITVPEALIPRAGQPSGRMVVGVTQGGPAEKAGLRVGDVLLSLNGVAVSGPQALRAFLGSDRIGSIIEVRFLRDGVVTRSSLVVAAQPS